MIRANARDLWFRSSPGPSTATLRAIAPGAHQGPALGDLSPPERWTTGGSHASLRATGRSAVDARAIAASGELLPKWDLDALDRKIAALSKLEMEGRSRIEVTRLGAIDHTSLYAIHLPAASDTPKLRVLVTGGVHGVEAAGPAAALAFVDHLLAHPELRRDVEVTVVPLVNPWGFRRHKRANGDGVDLNRAFSDSPGAPREVAMLREAIAGDSFDLSIDLHASKSVGRRGFFAIHNGGAELLTPAIADFSQRFDVVSESTALYAMDAPGIFKSHNAGTLKSYMKARGTRWAYTVEAPAQAPYETQVRGLVDFLGSATRHGLVLRAA